MNVIIFQRNNEEIGRVDLDTAIIREAEKPAQYTDEYRRLIDLWKSDNDNIEVVNEAGELVEDFPS